MKDKWGVEIELLGQKEIFKYREKGRLVGEN